MGSAWEVSTITHGLCKKYEEVDISLILGIFARFLLDFTHSEPFLFELERLGIVIFDFLWKPSDSVYNATKILSEENLAMAKMRHLFYVAEDLKRKDEELTEEELFKSINAGVLI